MAPGLLKPGRRPIHACPRCCLRFVPEAAHLSPERERARYRLHQNRLDDLGYVRFLGAAVEAVKRYVCPGASVLDYGSGPVPVLAELLRRESFEVTLYDHYFAPEADLSRRFDAVVSTETFEHFRRPRAEIDRIAAILRPGGVLVVMTLFFTPGQDFARWHYAADATHVAFYAEETFRFIACTWGLSLVETNGRNLVCLRR